MTEGGETTSAIEQPIDIEYVTHAQAKLREFEASLSNIARNLETDPITLEEAYQVGQFLHFLKDRPEEVVEDVHDAWVGGQDIENLRPNQKQFVVPYQKMDNQQLELEKTRGDVNGVLHALEGRFPMLTHISSQPNTVDTANLGKVAEILGLLANDAAFVTEAARPIQDSYLRATGQPHGPSFDALPPQQQATTRKNVRSDIVALAGYAQRKTQMPTSPAQPASVVKA